MNALRFAQKGAIESVLKLEQVPKPSLAAGEALVRVKAAGINGVRLITLISQPLSSFRRVLLTHDCDSPIVLQFKVGSPSLPFLVFPVGISLERLSMSLTSPLRSGLERRFGALGAPGVSRSMDPTQSKFLCFLWRPFRGPSTVF